MIFNIENISQEEIDQYKKDGFIILFVSENQLHYFNGDELKLYNLPPRKKGKDFYFVLLTGGYFGLTDDVKKYSKKIKLRTVSCVFDYNDELDLDNNSYRFLTEIPDILFKRFKTKFSGVATEVLVMKEENIKKDIETDNAL